MNESLIEKKILNILRDAVKAVVKDVTDTSLQNLKLSHPSDEKWGDYASNIALTLAKNLKQSPLDIAKDVSYEIKRLSPKFNINSNEYNLFDDITFIQPGFINLKLSTKWLQNNVREILTARDSYGSSHIGKKRRILVEYSQPNPNKPMHVGHARNNFLGNSISNTLRFVGYDVIEANYVNDMGVHICKSMLMYEKFGEGKEPDKKSDHFVGEFYAMFEREVEKNPSLQEEASEMFRKLEAKDPKIVALWEKIVGWAYKGWEKTYADENICFDLWQYQSHYQNTGKEIAKLAFEKGIAEKDATGAIVARLEKYGIPDKVLLRADGTSIYSTQDLQLAKDSFEKYDLYKRLYVVDYRQADYFKQIFKILEILGFPFAKDLCHISYGIVDLPEGHMSSRKGRVVNADTVFEKLIELEGIEVEKRLTSQKDFSEKENASTVYNKDKIIREVAMASFKYPLLKVDSKQNITFDYAYVTRFEGDTGPYLQYTHARACSVLRKGGVLSSKSSGVFESSFDVLSYTDSKVQEPEMTIIRSLYKFPEIVLKASINFAPSLICNYLFDLASRFNSFYNEVSILNTEDSDTRHFRLALTFATSQVLKNGLRLLGISAPEKM